MSGLRKLNLNEALAKLEITERKVVDLIHDHREALQTIVEHHKQGFINDTKYDWLRDNELEMIAHLENLLDFIRG